MGDPLNDDFDLSALLRSGSLDIRGIAAKNMYLPLKAYFDLLLKFAVNMYKADESLGRIINQRIDNNDLQYLSELKKILESIGCSKLTPDINSIIDASQMGDRKAASSAAYKVKENLEVLFDHIMKAKKDPEIPDNIQETARNARESYSASHGEYSLKKALQLLDYDEASRKMRILAVDDAPVMLKIISGVLSSEYDVYGMTNPRMIEKFLQQLTPELFLLDYLMPGRNGFELIPIIRSFAAHKTTPIIFLTSQGTMNNISAALALGACDFMVKPFQAEILREKVARHIVRKKLI